MRAGILCLVTLAAALYSVAADRPNIVFILADDLGYGDLSSYGATKVQTPNIDRLAIEGRKFTDAHIPQGRTDERSYRKSQNRPWETNRA